MMLRKFVEEYEILKSKMDVAQKEFGKQHHLVNEYRNQLDELCTRYLGFSKIYHYKKEK